MKEGLIIGPVGYMCSGKQRFREHILASVRGSRAVAAPFGDAIKSALENRQLLVLDGLRDPSTVEALLHEYPQIVLVGIEAPSDVRLRRMRKRGRPGEKNITDEAFLRLHLIPSELGIDELLKRATETVYNNSDDLAEYHRAIDNLLRMLM